MAGPLSKRQQARNEKVLQELVHKVPGNNFCADCQARNPTWASWSLGIFLCMRCASIHRKLGTHISKVKSLSMDGWSNEQVENMKKVGNITSNKLYNPHNKRPPIPIDVDEADSAMERFIRAKYMNQGFGGGTRKHDTGSTESDETPPPLPPKPSGKFSFRSATSIFPLGSKSSKAKREAAARGMHSGSGDLAPGTPGSPQRSKVSKVFGASIGYDTEDDMHKKLAKLRELGFTDDRKNETILKGVNGNLERTVETLIRIEGRSPFSSPTGDRTPTSSAPSASLTVARVETARPTSASTNPFDISPVQPISSQSTGNLANRNPYANNPFGLVATQSNDALNQAFNSMNLAPSQPLFPHHTGGVPNQQSQQVFYQQQSMAPPPVPAIPQDFNAMSFGSNQTYPQPAQLQQQQQQPLQPMQPMQTGYNPFFPSQQQPQPQPAQAQQSLSVNTGFGGGGAAAGAAGMYGGGGGAGYANNNPFARSPTRMTAPTPLGQIPEQAQQNFYSPPVQQQPQQNLYGPPPVQQQQPQPQQQVVSNPFFAQALASPAPQPTPQMSYFAAAQPAAAVAPQMPQRVDTASILALYGQPQQQQQPAPPQPFQVPAPQQQQPQQNGLLPNGAAPVYQAVQVQPRDNSTGTTGAQLAPVAAGAPGSKNPFLGGGSSPQTQPAVVAMGGGLVGGGGRSRDSIMASGMVEWSNGGRHSPDAFASLSARDVR